MSSRRLARLATGATALVALMAAAVTWAWPASGSEVSPSVEHGLVYTTMGGRPMRLDAYVPAHDGLVPAVLFVHGGGWVSGGRANYDSIAPRFTQAGFVAVSVDYTLATAQRATFPLAPEQVLDAVAFVRRHSAQWGVDPNAIGVMGDSAGAHLALLVAADPALVQPPEPVEAVAGWSGPYDLAAWRPDVGVLWGTGARLRIDVGWFLGCGGGDIDTAACVVDEVAASPDHLAHTGMPPAMLVTSQRYGPGCEIVDPIQTATMAQALRRAGDAVDVVTTSVCGHGLGYAGGELQRTIDFFRSTLVRR